MNGGIDVTVDTRESERFMRSMFRDQLPFVESLAVNDTAKDFQQKQRARMMAAFEVRRASFLNQSVKLKPFADRRARVREAKVAIDSPGDRDDIFAKFEDPGIKTPTAGRSLAIPQGDLAGTVIRKSQRPKSYNFQLRGQKAGTAVYTGRRGTYMIRSLATGRGVVFQRQKAQASSLKTRKVSRRGSNLSETRFLFSLVPQGKLTTHLRFNETARETVQERFDANFERAWDRAIRTAR